MPTDARMRAGVTYDQETVGTRNHNDYTSRGISRLIGFVFAQILNFQPEVKGP